MDATLREKLEGLPTGPGVYLMKDRAGKVIYVGKAVNLRSRVRSYFGRTSDGRAFIPLLDHLLADLETILTSNEKEALILENTLIKRHKPRFNVMLRDDKTFISLRLDRRHPYPRLEVARRPRRDGAEYFGPYSSASSIRETLRVVNRHFQLRTCSDQEFENRSRPCLEYQIHRCPAPCVLEVPREAYAESVRDVSLFLSGRADELTAHLTERMQAAAASERFEDAARVRDQLQAVARSLERQKVVQGEGVDQDVFGVHRSGPHLEVALLSVRQGRLHEGQQFHFSRQEFPTEELLGAFLTQFYERATTLPREVLLPLRLDNADALGEWLGERAGRAVQVVTPQRGEKLRLVAMANANAEQAHKEREARGGDVQETLLRLQHKLNLARLPRTIECYDISNFQGTESVGSKVAFRDGEPDKARYRRFRIRTVQGQDDFAMLYEVLTRRLRRGLEEGDLPDLLVIDGGMGQLQVAVAALRDLSVPGVEVVSLAKSRVLDSGRRLRSRSGLRSGPRSQAPEHSSERVFLPGVKDPIPLRPHTSELFLLQRLRDEAHRFAIQYHRGLRDKRTLGSELQDIPGVGPARRRALLRRFGSLKGIREASAEQLCEVGGVTRDLAERISQALSAAPHEARDPASA